MVYHVDKSTVQTAKWKLAQMQFCAQDKDLKKVICIQSHRLEHISPQNKTPWSKEITAPILLKGT